MKNIIKAKVLIAALVAVFLGLGLVGASVPASATAPASAVSASAQQVEPGVKVTLKSKAKIKKFKKVARCIARAGRVEQPAPPRDPVSKCKNLLKKAKFKTVAVSFCPAPLVGGWAKAVIRVSQRMVARALSKSVASGRVITWVRTTIKDLVRGRVSTSVDCVYPKSPPTPEPTPTTPPVTPTPTPTPTTPPPPTHPPTTPPVVPPPSLLEVDTVNDVVVDNTRTITVTGVVAKGHTANLFASAKNGGTVTSGKSQEVSGSFTVKVTYRAPSEVPSSGVDWVEFTLTQDDGQKAVMATNQFVITARPVTPL